MIVLMGLLREWAGLLIFGSIALAVWKKPILHMTMGCGILFMNGELDWEDRGF